MTNISVFAKEQAEYFKYRYEGTLIVTTLAGGTPSDPKVAEGWIKTKMGLTNDAEIQKQVAEVMASRGVTAEEAAAEVNINRHLNGFKRTPDGRLYIEGRQLKAGLKEAASCAVAADNLAPRGWGKTNKGINGFLAEHLFVVEDKLHLATVDGQPVTEPTGVNQRFVHTWRGSGIQYEEFVVDARIDFTVIADYDFSERDWAAIWTSGEQQGLGASRSQGYGRYAVTKWERVK